MHLYKQYFGYWWLRSKFRNADYNTKKRQIIIARQEKDSSTLRWSLNEEHMTHDGVQYTIYWTVYVLRSTQYCRIILLYSFKLT